MLIKGAGFRAFWPVGAADHDSSAQNQIDSSDNACLVTCKPNILDDKIHDYSKIRKVNHAMYLCTSHLDMSKTLVNWLSLVRYIYLCTPYTGEMPGHPMVLRKFTQGRFFLYLVWIRKRHSEVNLVLGAVLSTLIPDLVLRTLLRVKLKICINLSKHFQLKENLDCPSKKMRSIV